MKWDGGELAQRVRPLQRVGVYVPGGYTVYPSSLLMNVIPAQIAGVKEIVAVTPPRDSLDPLVAYTLDYLKVDEVYRVGGAQAVAALACGTKTIRRVDKIVGPGNLYVALAKKMVYGMVDIDMVAGPSEVVIVADDSVSPRIVAADMLAQAEHGTGDETALCITEDVRFAREIRRCVKELIRESPVKTVFSGLSSTALCVFVTDSRRESIHLSDEIAPEHLQLMTRTANSDLKSVQNAAAVFLGKYSPVVLGDYSVGTNHVLPTGGAARFASPLGVDDFVKRMSVARCTRKGFDEIAQTAQVLATAENFIHHAMSITCRKKC
jgi:histidinol dehydrogenase